LLQDVLVSREEETEVPRKTNKRILFDPAVDDVHFVVANNIIISNNNNSQNKCDKIVYRFDGRVYLMLQLVFRGITQTDILAIDVYLFASTFWCLG